MQNKNRIFDDMSKLMNNALGVAQGARTEAETAVKSMMDRWMAERDFVSREELEVAKRMAQKALEQVEALQSRLDELEKPKSKGKKA